MPLLTPGLPHVTPCITADICNSISESPFNQIQIMSAESMQRTESEFTNSNLEVLLSEEQIRQRVNELGAQISAEYANGDIVLIAILKGSCVFLADLMRAIDLKLTIDFMSVSSYKDGTESSGDVEILKDLSNPIRGKDVIVVEDIIDTGHTFGKIVGHSWNSRSQVDQARRFSRQTRTPCPQRGQDRLLRLCHPKSFRRRLRPRCRRTIPKSAFYRESKESGGSLNYVLSLV